MKLLQEMFGRQAGNRLKIVDKVSLVKITQPVGQFGQVNPRASGKDITDVVNPDDLAILLGAHADLFVEPLAQMGRAQTGLLRKLPDVNKSTIPVNLSQGQVNR